MFLPPARLPAGPAAHRPDKHSRGVAGGSEHAREGAAGKPRNAIPVSLSFLTGSRLRAAVMTAYVAVSFLAISLFVTAAYAQDSNVFLNAPGFLPKKPKPGLPDVKSQPAAWPRLDPGAVLCRTESDLDRLAARRRGEQVEGPVDCKVIRVPTAISIVQRSRPGLTEVQTTDAQAGGVGWTDVWLPERAPRPGASASR